MSTTLRIEPETVENLAGQINSIHDNEIKDILGRLRQLNDQLDQAWDGPSQILFTEKYGDWIVQLDNFSTTLTGIYRYLNSVVENYRAMDDAAKAAIHTSIE
ncbi:MAG: WXG100 family type VII secretion target [Anaerolineales bacterium]|nr:WXG100 family type VII secretion target [Anaerolineales bacterium]